jgi:hypothetical protein
VRQTNTHVLFRQPTERYRERATYLPREAKLLPQCLSLLEVYIIIRLPIIIRSVRHYYKCLSLLEVSIIIGNVNYY